MRFSEKLNLAMMLSREASNTLSVANQSEYGDARSALDLLAKQLANSAIAVVKAAHEDHQTQPAGE